MIGWNGCGPRREKKTSNVQRPTSNVQLRAAHSLLTPSMTTSTFLAPLDSCSKRSAKQIALSILMNLIRPQRAHGYDGGIELIPSLKSKRLFNRRYQPARDRTSKVIFTLSSFRPTSRHSRRRGYRRDLQRTGEKV